MTLRASKTKRSPVFGVFCATLSKNTGSIILLSIAMLIFCPGFLLAALSKTAFRPEDYYSPEMLNAVYGVTAIFSCILVCIGNYVSFAYLYKKSSSDVFGALPLTRGGMLFSRAAAAFIGVLIPVTIGYTALAILTALYPTYVIGTVAQIASAYLVNVLLMLAFSGFSLIFIMCAGSGFDLVLSFCGFNLAVLVVGAVLHSLCNSYLSGYSDSYIGFLSVMSPVYYLAERGVFFAEGGYVLKGSGDIIFGILKYAAVFCIIDPLLYRFRKAERGEQAYAYKFIYVICGVLAGICGGYALSEIFVTAADLKTYSIVGFVSFTAGALITTVVYGAVTDRGFKGFKRAMAVGAVSAVVYGMAAVIIISGAFGFETRLPAADKVTAATVRFDDNVIAFTDAKDVIALHKAIIDKRADDEYKDTVDSPHTYVDISYELKGKDEMLREYFVDKSKVKRELFKIYSSDNRFEDIEKTVNAATYRIDVWGDFYIGDDSVTLNGTVNKEGTRKLIETYKKELKAVGEEIFSPEKQTRIVASVNLIVENNRESSSFSIYTTADFPETNSILSAFQVSDTDIKG